MDLNFKNLFMQMLINCILQRAKIPQPKKKPRRAAPRGAYERTCSADMLPMGRAASITRLAGFPAAAARAPVVGEPSVRDWSMRLSLEPATTNRHASD